MHKKYYSYYILNLDFKLYNKIYLPEFLGEFASWVAEFS